MPIDDKSSLVLHYAPRTRSFTALWGLEEIGIPYRLEVHRLAENTHRSPEFLAINPMGKLPAVVDEGIPCAETGALLAWLGDRYAAGTLAPNVGEPDRPRYLRWLFFAGSVLEPALGERFFKWQVPDTRVAWGSFERMERTLSEAVASGPWLLGDRFTLADVAVGAGARFGVRFGAISDSAISAYVERCEARPAFARATAIEAAHIPAEQ